MRRNQAAEFSYMLKTGHADLLDLATPARRRSHKA